MDSQAAGGSFPRSTSLERDRGSGPSPNGMTNKSPPNPYSKLSVLIKQDENSKAAQEMMGTNSPPDSASAKLNRLKQQSFLLQKTAGGAPADEAPKQLTDDEIKTPVNDNSDTTSSPRTINSEWGKHVKTESMIMMMEQLLSQMKAEPTTKSSAQIQERIKELTETLLQSQNANSSGDEK